MKIVFMATPDIALNSFEYFINSKDYEVLALVTQKAKAQNRGKKIVERNISKIAKADSIPIFEPDKISKDEDVIKELKKLEPDYFITFAFGQILSQEVISIPKIATINLHASLLPQYRGANPIAQSIIEGNVKTGISTMVTVLELDAGDVCLQDEIEITPDMNVIELSDIISKKAPLLLDKTLKGLKNGTIIPKAQDSAKATFTKKLKKEEKAIDWNMSAQKLHDKIRGMYQINTNHAVFNGKIIKILKTSVVKNENGNEKPGETINVSKEGITVKCGNDALLLITVKPEGKGEMKSFDWANGAKIKKGDFFD